MYSVLVNSMTAEEVVQQFGVTQRTGTLREENTNLLEFSNKITYLVIVNRRLRK